MILTKLSKKSLEETARAQPMEYFEKYQSIVIHNLLVELHNANRERKRGPEYYMTYEILLEVNVKPRLLELWLVMDVIETKKRLEKQ